MASPRPADPIVAAGAEQRDVAALLDSIATRQRLLQERRAAAGRTLAPDFSIFQFCRTDELGLSQLICWMLDPAGSHNQGAAFLGAFFEIFDIDHRGLASLERACARPEVTTHAIRSSRRRMDIEVSCRGFTLAIENKPYAGFQHRQLLDYCAHLEKTSPGAYALVVLKGRAQPIPKAQLRPELLEDGRLIEASYAELARWVETCAERSAAEPVARFLREFAIHIHEEFLAGVTMEEQSIILEELKTPERRRVALDLITAAEGLYDQLHGDLHAALRKAAPEWSIEADAKSRVGRSDGFTHKLTFDFKRTLPVLLGFDLYAYGVSALISVKPRAGVTGVARRHKAIGRALRARFPVSGRTGYNWLWWAHDEDLTGLGILTLNDANIWKAAIEPDVAAPAIIELARKFEAVIREADAEYTGRG